MSKTNVQKGLEILSYTGSLAIGGSISGSVIDYGMSKIIGIVFSDASSMTGSGIIIKQSIDGGENWDHQSTWDISACDVGNSAFELSVIGDAVKIEYRNGSEIASNLRMKWYTRPV